MTSTITEGVIEENKIIKNSKIIKPRPCKNKGIFKTLSNISGGAFLRK